MKVIFLWKSWVKGLTRFLKDFLIRCETMSVSVIHIDAKNNWSKVWMNLKLEELHIDAYIFSRRLKIVVARSCDIESIFGNFCI